MAARFLSFVVLTGLLATTGNADDEVFSGPQPGEQLSAFQVLRVQTPDSVKKVKLLGGDAKKDTALVIFMHKLSEPALGLMITLEWYAGKQKELDGHYVLLTEDREKTESIVKRWAGIPLFANSVMSISLDGPEGPGAYGLNRNVAITVLIAKENKVVSNFVLNAPNNTDAPRILDALASALGQDKAPTLEKIRTELRAERNRRRELRQKQNPIFKLAPNEEVGRIMLGMIFREGVNEEVAAGVAARLAKWAGDDKEKRAALKKYAAAILDSDFEINRYARAELEKLAKP